MFVGGGDYTLECGSPCINAGDDETLPADVVDVDEINGNEEPLPVDLVFHARVIGTDSDDDALDMGAFETSYVSCYGDLDDDNDVDGDDVLIVIGNWGTCMGDPCVGDLAPGGPCSAVGDGEVGVSDLLTVIANYGRCEESLWNTMNGPSAEQCLDCVEAAAELDLSDEEWIDFMIECLSGE